MNSSRPAAQLLSTFSTLPQLPGRMEDPRLAFLSMMQSISQEDLVHRLIQLIHRLRSHSPSYHPTVLDLSCLVRTLWQLRYLTKEQICNGYLLSRSIDAIIEAKSGVESLCRASEHPALDETSILMHVQQALFGINRFFSMTRFLIPPPEYLLQYGNLLVHRKMGHTRYMIDANCVYEDDSVLLQLDWGARYPGVLEHIGLRSGGTEYYDPTFISRQPSSARQFFTVGRVFMVLWNVDEIPHELREVVDEDRTIPCDRGILTGMEGSFTGPYTGPTTVRSFIVISEGVRSSYCLPVSTFNLQGCSRQRDQENYGVIFTGNRADMPSSLPGECGMVRPSIHVESELPFERWSSNSLLQKTSEPPPPPPYSALPTKKLPAQSRIDYRRLCEVEHNVCCRNIGIVSTESVVILQEHAACLGLHSQEQDSHIMYEDAMDIC